MYNVLKVAQAYEEAYRAAISSRINPTEENKKRFQKAVSSYYKARNVKPVTLIAREMLAKAQQS